MNLFSLSQAPLLQAGDGTLLREIFHPRNTGIDMPYSLAQAMLMPGEASTPHVLRASDEVYVVLVGEGMVHVDGEDAAVQAGDIVHIPAGSEQWIENTGEVQLTFLCVVSPPWSAGDEESR